MWVLAGPVPGGPTAITPATVIWLLFLLGLVGVVIAGIFYRPRRSALDREPRCASCGYIVRDLPSDICPECGSNICVTGTSVRRIIPELTLRRKLVAWTAVMAIVTLFSSNGAAVLFGHWLADGPANMATLTSIGLPQLQIVIYAAEHAANGQMSLTMPWSPSCSSMRLYRPSLTYETSDISPESRPASNAPIDAAVLRRWLATANVSEADRNVRAAADEILRILQRLADGDPIDRAVQSVSTMTAQTTRVGSVGLYPPTWYDWRIFWPPGVLIWLAGVWVLRRK